ncbi:MAG: hypothetical protein ACKVYV_00675 [Limisphaerales bacterium]
MSLRGARSRLAALTLNLRRDWDETQQVWHDDRSREFEQRYLAELFAAVDRAAAAMESLDQVIQKVKSECEQNIGHP